MLHRPFIKLRKSIRVYCFLDLEHPAVAWAVMRGMLVSADHVASPADGFISFMQAGIIEHLNSARLYNELLIETVRQKLFPKQVSRLRGMFFFQSRHDAEERIGDPKWPRYFESKNLLELELRYEDNFTDVDANWITFAPIEGDGRISVDNLQWIGRYWAGEPYNNNPVWERIAKGIALILDEKVRRQCYDYLREFFPSSHIPILMARLAGEAGTRGGLITPFLLRQDEKLIQLGYLWSDAEFHDPTVIAAIHHHPDSGTLGRMMAESEGWRSPDFRPWGKVFQFGEQSLPDLTSFTLPSLHHPN